MTLEETIDLLTTCAAYDRRTIGKTDAVAWHAVVGDLPFDLAQQAVFAHYGESTDWIMPAHVRTRVKRNQRDEAERGRIRELLDPDTYRREIEQAGDDFLRKLKAIGAANPDDSEPLAGWKAVQCPVCEVKPGEFCRNPKTGDKTATHGRRRRAAGE